MKEDRGGMPPKGEMKAVEKAASAGSGGWGDGTEKPNLMRAVAMLKKQHKA